MRALIFLNYRAGSTLIQHTFNQTPWFVFTTEPKQTELTLLPTASQCYVLHVGLCQVLDTIEKYKSLENLVLMTHIGNWWGDLPSDQVPDPYEGDSPMRWGIDELLPLEGWKLLYVMRDGRNQIESMRNFKGGIEEQLNKNNPEDFFKVLCKGWRNRTRVALDNEKQLSNFRIFKFEDMMKDSQQFFQAIYDFLELSPQMDFIMKRVEELRDKQTTHSSFATTDTHQRWLSWTSQERDLFMQTCGVELAEAGYQ